jgi:hypothetical protein
MDDGSIADELCDNETNNLLRICNSFTPASFDDIMMNGVEFGDNQRHKTLVFDMDETLLHAVLTTKD